MPPEYGSEYHEDEAIVELKADELNDDWSICVWFSGTGKLYCAERSDGEYSSGYRASLEDAINWALKVDSTARRLRPAQPASEQMHLF